MTVTRAGLKTRDIPYSQAKPRPEYTGGRGRATFNTV
jgi:hypothetical protein